MHSDDYSGGFGNFMPQDAVNSVDGASIQDIEVWAIFIEAVELWTF